MKTITIKVDDQYAGLMSANFIESNQAHTTIIFSPTKQIYDGMVITIYNNGNVKTEVSKDEKR